MEGSFFNRDLLKTILYSQRYGGNTSGINHKELCNSLHLRVIHLEYELNNSRKENEELGRLYRNKEYKLETKIIAQRRELKNLNKAFERARKKK
jgi:hypothetical protein